MVAVLKKKRVFSEAQKASRREYNKKFYLSKRTLDKQYRYERRKHVIEVLGGACICCGESEFRFLEIDHINNDGNIDRKTRKGDIIAHIVKEGIPKDKYQLLCGNCHNTKSYGNGCTHQTFNVFTIGT